MLGQELRDFVDGALDAGRLAESDVARLSRHMQAQGGVTRRAEVDALAAMDRMLTDKHPSWDDAFVNLVVAHVVADAQATGQVERDAVNWLMTTLDAAGAMTDNGLRIAIEVTRIANHADQTLMTCVLQTLQARRPATQQQTASHGEESPCEESHGEESPCPGSHEKQGALAHAA